jgi:hypothetical protein
LSLGLPCQSKWRHLNIRFLEKPVALTEHSYFPVALSHFTEGTIKLTTVTA